MEENSKSALSEQISMINTSAIKRFAKNTSKAADEKINEAHDIENQINQIDQQYSLLKIKKEMSDEEKQQNLDRRAELKSQKKALEIKKTLALQKATALESASDEYSFMYSVLTHTDPPVDFRKTERINEKKEYDEDEFLALLERMIKEGKVTNTAGSDTVNEITLNPFVNNPKVEKKVSEPIGAKERGKDDELEKSKNAILMGEDEEEEESQEVIQNEEPSDEDEDEEEEEEPVEEEIDPKKEKRRQGWKIAIGVILLVVLIVLLLIVIRKPKEEPAVEEPVETVEPSEPTTEEEPVEETPIVEDNSWSFTKSYDDPFGITVTASSDGVSTVDLPDGITQSDILTALAALDSAYPGKYTNVTFNSVIDGLHFYYPTDASQEEVESEFDAAVNFFKGYIAALPEIEDNTVNVPDVEAWHFEEKYSEPFDLLFVADPGKTDVYYPSSIIGTDDIFKALDKLEETYPGLIDTLGAKLVIESPGKFNVTYATDYTETDVRYAISGVIGLLEDYLESLPAPSEPEIEVVEAEPWTFNKTYLSPFVITVDATSTSATVTFPSYITDEEIRDAASALVRFQPGVYDSVAYSLTEEGKLTVTYPELKDSSEAESEADYLVSLLTEYIDSLNSEEVAESEPWQLNKTYSEPLEISVSADKNSAVVTFPSYITDKDIADAASALLRYQPGIYDSVEYSLEGEGKLSVSYPELSGVEEAEREADYLVSLLTAYIELLNQEEPWTFTKSYADPFPLKVTANSTSATVTFPSYITDEEISDAATALLEYQPGVYDSVEYSVVDKGMISVSYPELNDAENAESEADYLVSLLKEYVESLNQAAAEPEVIPPEPWTFEKSYSDPLPLSINATSTSATVTFPSYITEDDLAEAASALLRFQPGIYDAVTYSFDGNGTLTVNYPELGSSKEAEREADYLVSLLRAYIELLNQPEPWTFTKSYTDPMDLKVTATSTSAVVTFPSYITADDISSAAKALVEYQPGVYDSVEYSLRDDGTLSVAYPELGDANQAEREADYLVSLLKEYIASLNQVEIEPVVDEVEPPEPWTFEKSYSEPLDLKVTANANSAVVTFPSYITDQDIEKAADALLRYQPAVYDSVTYSLEDEETLSLTYPELGSPEEAEREADYLVSLIRAYIELLNQSENWTFVKSYSDPFELTVTADSTSATVEFPSYITEEEIRDAALALVNYVPSVYDNVAYSIEESGLLKVTYPELSGSDEAEREADYLVSLLKEYIEMLNQEEAAVVPWTFEKSYSDPIPLSVKADSTSAVISFPEYITEEEIRDAALALIEYQPGRYDSVSYIVEGSGTLKVAYPELSSEEEAEKEADYLVSLLKEYVEFLNQAPFDTSIAYGEAVTIDIEKGHATVKLNDKSLIFDAFDGIFYLSYAKPDEWQDVSVSLSLNDDLIISYPEDYSKEEAEDAVNYIVNNIRDIKNHPDRKLVDPEGFPVTINTDDPVSIKVRAYPDRAIVSIDPTIAPSDSNALIQSYFDLYPELAEKIRIYPTDENNIYGPGYFYLEYETYSDPALLESDINSIISMLKAYLDSASEAATPVEEASWHTEKNITDPLELYIVSESGKTDITYPESISENDISGALEALENEYPGLMDSINAKVEYTTSGHLTVTYPETYSESDVNYAIDQLIELLTVYLQNN